MDHEDWNVRYGATDLVWGADPNRFVVAELESRTPQGRALDLACGEGRNAIWLAERGWKVTAVDFSDVAIERASKLADGRGVDVEWLCRDLMSYEPTAEEFQLAMIVYLQVPAADLRRVVAHAAAALAPEGELLMIGHARRNLSEGIGGPRDPAVLWTTDEVRAAFEAANLRVERCDEVLRSVDTPDGPREAIDVLARAIRPT